MLDELFQIVRGNQPLHHILHGAKISHGDNQGYWGPPTSTVDWCELNYTVSHYVAEFFNTISSLSIVFVGLLGIIHHYKTLETRFIVGFGSVALVGLGSAAFHGTLLFELQVIHIDDKSCYIVLRTYTDA